jgi:hypothetical protein
MAQLEAVLNSMKDVPEVDATSVAGIFQTMLNSHGEVQLVMASGATYSIHLGDKGTFDVLSITLVDKEGSYNVLLWSQVEGMFFHKGYKE